MVVKRVDDLPDEIGVYILKDEKGNILYREVNILEETC